MESRLILSTKRTAQGKTRLDQYFVSPPFKLMTLPVYDNVWQNGLNAMQMSSSPGLLAGDKVDIRISLAADTALSLTTQAFTRVQSMHGDDYAHQHSEIRLANSAKLSYLPHPLVLHKDSALKQSTLIYLAPQTELIYGEIVAIGRVLNGERFAFRHFASNLKIYDQAKQRLLLSDRIQWRPATADLTALGQMENYSHQGALVYCSPAKSTLQMKAVLTQIQSRLPQTEDMLIGCSLLNEGGFMLRVLAHRADSIQRLFAQLSSCLKTLKTE
ncbi:urease accessory protein UreD [Pasteurellaceae bacterium LIM206]|nr:urease accessory protein UreD [Pasteurellaceae bacterium LIM206]